MLRLSIIQFFLGFSAAAFFGPMMADISKYFNKRKGLAVSLVASGQHLCGAIWPFLIKDFLLEGDWRNAHLFIALVCSIFIPILFYFIGDYLQSQKIIHWLMAKYIHKFKFKITNK